jgi:hypothetical protein
MCGIIAAFGVEGLSSDQLRALGLKLSKLLRHRGPDASALHLSPNGQSFLAHERLNIVDASDRGRCVAIVLPAASAASAYRLNCLMILCVQAAFQDIH